MGKNIMRSRKSSGRYALHVLSAAVLTLGTAQVVSAAVFPEVEPNDNKAGANAVGPMVPGDSITGVTTGSSTTVAGPASADNFLISFPAAVPGIYRNRLVLTSQTLAHVGTIRGLTQTDLGAGIGGAPTAGSDATLQTSSTATVPPRYNQFYTFGQPTQMYYRVTGVATTTADYSSTLENVRVTPTNIGTYVPGNITITTIGQGHTTDTDFWVYDGAFNAIPTYGNDDESVAGGGTGATLQSLLTRNYAPGTYYVAMSNFAVANNQPAAGDDDFRTGTLMDFAGVVMNSSTSTTANLTFTITDSAGTTLQVPNTHASQFDINWFEFTVVPEPGTLGLLAAGLPLLFRRRRA
jgi:hypothetical protein